MFTKVFFLALMASLHQGQGDMCKIPNVEMPPVQQAGKATYYGDPSNKDNDGGMHGQITASGEPFDPMEQTCASRTIPLGTYVLIENETTGGKGWCKVNDRGPYGIHLENGEWAAMLPSDKGYVIRKRKNGGWAKRERYNQKPGHYYAVMDLSYGMAKALDFDFKKGLNRIKIRFHKASFQKRIVSRWK